MSDADQRDVEVEPAAAERALYWLSLALGDLEAAGGLLGPDVPLRIAANHAQMAAEKALKAAIALDGRDPPRIHDLAALALTVGPAFRDELELVDVDALTEAGAAGRYPGLDDEPYDRDGVDALIRDARAIVERVTKLIGDRGIDLSELAAM